MSTFEKKFYDAVRVYINTKTHSDGSPVLARQVTCVDQGTQFGGYCETCAWERIVLEISYIEEGTGRSRLYTYDGDMAELMREL